MYVLYYASMLQCWHLIWILVRTDHPCLGVRYHISIHLWCSAAFGVGAAVATSQCRILMMRREVMSQEPLNMT
jgi:hypothetical protein